MLHKNAPVENRGGLQTQLRVRRGLQSQKSCAGGPAAWQKQPVGGRLWHRIDLTDGWAARQEQRPLHPPVHPSTRSAAARQGRAGHHHQPWPPHAAQPW